MSVTRELGVALVNREGESIRYSITDEFSHYCGDVIETNGVMTAEDKYGMEIPASSILYHLMVTGVAKYQEWASRH